MKRLNIGVSNQFMVKKFKSAPSFYRRHGFLEATLAEGDILTAEAHLCNEHTTIIFRLKKANGEMLTRTAKSKIVYSDITAEQAFKTLCLAEDSQHRVVIESKICSDNRIMDYKIYNDNKVLRIGDIGRLRSSILPVKRPFGMASVPVIENFLEVFKGTYDPQYLYQGSDNPKRRDSYPNTILFGQRFVKSDHNEDATFFQNGYAAVERNTLLRNATEGSVATVENFKGESITLAVESQKHNLMFFGFTKDFGKIAISFDKTSDNVPDVNISKIRAVIDILKYFDITPELEMLNYVRASNTIVSEFQSEQMLDIAKKLLSSTLQ